MWKSLKSFYPFFVSECKKLYNCKKNMIQKRGGLLVFLVGNQTRGSQVAFIDIYEGWDWSATRGNQASPTITSLKKEKQHRHKKHMLRQATRPERLVAKLTIHLSRTMMCFFPSSTKILLSSFWEIVRVFLMWVGAPCPSAGVMSM
jgi:hypothetical protein